MYAHSEPSQYSVKSQQLFAVPTLTAFLSLSGPATDTSSARCKLFLLPILDIEPLLTLLSLLQVPHSKISTIFKPLLNLCQLLKQFSVIQLVSFALVVEVFRIFQITHKFILA